jgi:hypothetical protein
VRRLPVRLLLATAVGATFVASVAAAAPAPSTQRVRATSGPVLALAADGNRAAFVVEGRVKECMSVMVWEPARRRAARLQSAATCESNDRPNRRGMPTVALAGTRAAWLWITGGNTLETIISSATLARPRPIILAYGGAADGVAGSFTRRPVGDGSLLVFTQETHCHPDYELSICPPGRERGDITEATVWRVTGGRRACVGRPTECSVVVRRRGELTVLAVDGGRIAVRTETGLTLFTSAGRVLRDFAVRPQAAALSRNRLVARTASALDVYDTRTGERTAQLPVPSGVRLQDLDRDILVTAGVGTVTLRRLGDGRTSTLRVGRPTFAQLEPSGLFVAGSRRVTFTPIRDVLRRLGG